MAILVSKKDLILWFVNGIFFFFFFLFEFFHSFLFLFCFSFFRFVLSSSLVVGLDDSWPPMMPGKGWRGLPLPWVRSPSLTIGEALVRVASLANGEGWPCLDNPCPGRGCPWKPLARLPSLATSKAGPCQWLVRMVEPSLKKKWKEN